MRKNLPLIALLALMLFGQACDKCSSDKTTTSAAPEVVNVDGAELLDALEGKWVSDEDTALVLSFSSATLTVFRNGQPESEAEITANTDCREGACIYDADTLELERGWCFEARSASATRCHLVTTCTNDSLYFTYLEAPDKEYRYHRVRD